MAERRRRGIRRAPAPLGIAAPGGALVSLAAALGLVVGVRSIASLELPGVRTLLGLEAIAREPMGITWTSRVLWPDQVQEVALGRIGALVTALFLAAAAVSLLNALVLLLEAGSARRREVAIRAALGAGPARLLSMLGRDVRRLLSIALGLGLLLGMALGGAVRASWPGGLAAVEVAEAGATLLPVLGALVLVSAVAYVGVGLRIGRGRALSESLGTGGRASAGAREAFQRRALSAVQMGVAGAVSLGTLALTLSVTKPLPEASAGSGPVVVVSVEAPAGSGGPGWAGVLDRIGRLEGMRAESLATPGALVGLGVRDHATAQCGNCWRGGLPLPFWGAVADHHAVAPGWFTSAGMRVAEGRDFSAEDDADAPRVAIVNRTFANTAFERGEPIGRLVRLGRRVDAWFEVVGVVEERPTPVVGRDELPRAAIWVSALQQPPTRADVLLSGSETALQEATALLERGGFSVRARSTLVQERARAAAPLAWTARVAFALGLLTLALAVHGARATSLQVTRRRVRELAIRRVLGATDRRILLHVLAGSARTALWGSAVAVFFGALLVGLLRRAAGGVPAPGPAAYVSVAVLLVLTALLASMRAAREALRVEPGRAVE